MQFYHGDTVLSASKQQIDINTEHRDVFTNVVGVVTVGGNCTIEYWSSTGSLGTLKFLDTTPLTIQGLSVAYFKVTGSGTLTLDASGPEYVDPRSLTPNTTSISGTVTANATDNITKIAGVAVPATAGGMPIEVSGAIVDPRAIRALTASDTPAVTLTAQSAGLALDASLANLTQKTQLPAALDGSGNLKIRALTSSDTPAVTVTGSPTVVLGAGTNIAMKTPVPMGVLIEQELLTQTALPENTARATKVAGSTTLALGQRVFFSLACMPIVNVAAATEVFAYVSLVGATSGAPYATAYAGESVSSSFEVTTAEKLNIVWANSSAATGANAAAWWAAMSP